MDIGFILTIVALIIGVISSPIIHERFIDPYHFKRKNGRIISGEYFAVWYTNTNTPPVTWEKGKITQKGKKIKYQCRENDSGFDYELIGQIDDDIITGHWKSNLPNEKVHGGATLHFTKRGHLVGMWVGDSKSNNFTWGYWAISKEKEALDIFVENMQNYVKFKGVDMLKLFDKKTARPTKK